MDMVRHYRLMADYNAWMNRRLYAVCSDIPDQQRKEDLGAFFKSIHGTLNHILWGDRAWMGRFTGDAFPVGRMGEDLFDDFARLREARESMDVRIIAWTQTLTLEDLNRKLVFRSLTDGKQRRASLWCFASHLFNHQTHHRGQITTLMKQLGCDPGITDIPYMPGVVQISD